MHYDLITIDPSTQGHGIACFMGKTLVKAEYVRAHHMHSFGQRSTCDVLMIEVPQKYPSKPGQKNKGASAASLIQLSFAAGYACGHIVTKELVQIFPRDWTGRVKKEDRNIYLQESIGGVEAECIALPSPYLAHNVWDAIGIGLFRLGRAKW